MSDGKACPSCGRTVERLSGNLVREVEGDFLVVGPPPPSRDEMIETARVDAKAALAAQRQLLLARQAELERWSPEDQAHFEAYFGPADGLAFPPYARYGTTKQLIVSRLQRVLELNAATTSDDLVPLTPEFRGKFTTQQSYGAVLPGDPDHRIHYGPEFLDTELVGRNSKAGVLTHEMSHFSDVGNTSDYAYGEEHALELAVESPAKAFNNADNFEYWVEGDPE